MVRRQSATMIRLLVVLGAAAAAVYPEDHDHDHDHEFFFDHESEFVGSPSEHVRVTRDGGGFDEGFHGGFYSPSMERPEARAANLFPLTDEYERIR